MNNAKPKKNKKLPNIIFCLCEKEKKENLGFGGFLVRLDLAIS
jgi:hypothetical protein